MARTKIACLGAGSLYFPQVLGEIAITPGLAESEVALYDLDLDKAKLMAALGRRLSQAAGARLRVRAGARLADALDGAAFAVSSIGGSGVSMGGVYGTAAHDADLLMPARYGIYQIIGDTAGPAGMMMGLRSVPAHLAICREMQKRCPDAVMLNHSNPMAVLCRAMVKYGGIERIVGICHGVQNGIAQVAALLGAEPEDLETVWIGTNHYYWFTRIRLRGRDVYPEVMAKAAARPTPHGQQMSQALSEAYGYRLVYCEDGHALEFYPYLAQLRAAAEAPYGYGERLASAYAALDRRWRQRRRKATPPRQATLRKQQLRELKQRLDKCSLPQGAREARPSAIRGEGIGGLIDAIASGRREVRIVNIPNRGVVANLPNHAILEVEAVTDSCGVRGIQVGEAPLSLMGMLHKRIAWQELVADAAAQGDRNLALQALLLDEMAIPPEKAAKMLDELLAASRDLLPQFRD
jgi:alpha-galactosidase